MLGVAGTGISTIAKMCSEFEEPYEVIKIRSKVNEHQERYSDYVNKLTQESEKRYQELQKVKLEDIKFW